MRKACRFKLVGRFAAAALSTALASTSARAGASEHALQRAGALLGRGDPAGAEREASGCAGDGGATGARCLLVIGRARFGRADLAGAAQALGGAHVLGLGPLATVGDLLLAEALLHTGAPAEAAALLRPLAQAPGAWGAKAAALLADALFEAGDLKAAALQASAALGLDALPSATKGALSWTRAEALTTIALRTAGGVEGETASAPAAAREAQQALRTLWRDFPDAPGAEQAQQREAWLVGIAGGPLPAPTGREHLGRAQRLLGAGLPAAAVVEAKAARGLLAGEERAEASLAVARALGADGKRQGATASLEEAWAASTPRTAAAAGLLLARDRARRARNPEAIALLDLLLKRFPDAPEADDAAFLAARLLLDMGRTDDARKRLFKLSALRRAGPASDARWTLAWLSYRERRKDAAERFAACAAAAEDDDGRARGFYWQGRAGTKSQAAARFARAASLDPLGWYGLLARAALGAPRLPPPPFPPARAPHAGRSEVPAPLREQLELPWLLLDLGLHAEAALELERYLAAHHGRRDELLPALAALEEAGRTDRSVPIAQQLLLGRPVPLEFREPERALHGAQDKSARALLDLAYPAAFAPEVAAAAKRTGLDPYFLLAIARRESVFRADARSAAGAVGLLQLLPATARRAAAVLRRPLPTDDELTQPGAAIDLGAWYLAELAGRFGDPAIAAAAYNAGPRAVGPWVSKGAGQPLDVWVEEIPFRETRRYVKIVIGAWSAYRQLAGGGPPTLAATVPAAESGAEF